MKKIVWILFLGLCIHQAAECIAQGNADSLQERHVRPGDTDPLIWLWNSDSNYVYINHTAPILNKLFVFLPGSYGVPQDDKAINQKAANMGYHSIGLRYPNTWSMIGECGNSTDTNCHYNVRMEVFYGLDTYAGINVDTVNCIKNRLVKLLLYLDANYPAEGWGQYLDTYHEPVWQQIAMGGHSQGGGYGALVGLSKQLFRILNFASNDYSNYFNKPASWYYFPTLTAIDRYYSMAHMQDGPQEFLEMMFAIGANTSLTVNVDTCSFSFHNAKILFTNATPASGTGWMDYHNSMAVDNSIPLDTAGTYLFAEVWRYMLYVDTASSGIFYTQPMEENGNDVWVYPNPANESITITTIEKALIEILNVQGQVIKGLTSEGKIDFDVSFLAKGIYFVRAKTESGVVVRKFVKE